MISQTSSAGDKRKTESISDFESEKVVSVPDKSNKGRAVKASTKDSAVGLKTAAKTIRKASAKGTAGDTVYGAASHLQKLEQENAALKLQLAEQTAELNEARSEALQAMELKAQFMANISHELRTPLSGVLGMAELLKEMVLTEDQEELVSYIYVSAAGLVDVVNSLLDFSRLQAGKLKIEKSEFSLDALLSQVSELYSETAHKKGLELKVSKNNVPAKLVGDAPRIKQVLAGLTNNAIKFSDKGTILISVELENRIDKTVIVRFSVQDSGIGVEASEQERIFMPFVQVDGSNTRKYGGVGLGLPICKRLVKLMSGSIGVKSKAGHGATFAFSVPLEVKE